MQSEKGTGAELCLGRSADRCGGEWMGVWGLCFRILLVQGE